MRMSGLLSSGIAVASLVDYDTVSARLASQCTLVATKHTCAGSQATALTAFLPRLFKVKDSFFALTSHTVTNPPLLPVTRICGTFLFQSSDSKSSARAADVPRRNGFATLLRSDMKSYA